MFIKSITFLFFVCFFTQEALSQRPNTAENLKCYHCDPSDLKINGNAGIRMPCLQDEDDLGELKHCALENQLCMKGEMQFEGNTVDVRRCQLAAGKAGQCEKIHIMEIETEVCYCDTDGCNGTSNVLPQSFAILLAISAVLMMFGFKWKR